MLKSVLALGVAILVVGSQARASLCPLGPKEDHLTIQRVMRNFGKFTAAADDVIRSALSSSSSGQSVPADDIVVKAIGDLAIVEACASETVLGNSPDLLPAKARTDAAVAADFKKVMSEFQAAVTAEAQALEAARSTHDFNDARAKKVRVDQIADEAHAHF